MEEAQQRQQGLHRPTKNVFYLESLREESLPTLRERWLSRTGIVLACIVLGGLIGKVIDWSQTDLGLSIGLAVSLIGAFTKLQPVEILRFSFTDARPRIAKAMRDGPIVGVIVGLIVGAGMGVGVGLLRLITTEVVESSRAPNQGTRDSIKNAFFGLTIVGSSVGVIVKLSDGRGSIHTPL
jgi:hypothetical protein